MTAFLVCPNRRWRVESTPKRLKSPKADLLGLQVVEDREAYRRHKMRVAADWLRSNHFTRGKGKRDAVVLLDPLLLLSHLQPRTATPNYYTTVQYSM